MRVHEGLLEDNNVRVYLGQVIKVSRSVSEGGPVTDYVGNELSPMEILFSVGGIITESRAIPLDQTNEVKEGDFIIVFSLENIYNATYYYHAIRFMSRDNDSIYMAYKDTEIRLIPKSETETNLLIAANKSIINIDPSTRRINIESDNGGININSHEGYFNISNDETSLKTILEKLIDSITNLKVLTHAGPAPITPTSAADLLNVSREVNKLFSNIESNYLYPNLPENTYTVEFAAEAVGLLGINFLNDHGSTDFPDSKIVELQNKFPQDELGPVRVDPITLETSLGNTEKIVLPKEQLYLETDIQLSPNFKLSQVTNKCTFPHQLKEQHGLSKNDIVHSLKTVALNILEPIYTKYPNMVITSGFRGRPSLIGSISQHELGEAVDLQFPGMTSQEYLDAAKWVLQNVEFDQFIFEHGKSIWFHLTCKREGDNRKKTLTMLEGDYSPGITLYYT